MLVHIFHVELLAVVKSSLQNQHASAGIKAQLDSW